MRLLKTCNKTNYLSYVIKSSSASVKWSLHCPFDQLSVKKREKKNASNIKLSMLNYTKNIKTDL